MYRPGPIVNLGGPQNVDGAQEYTGIKNRDSYFQNYKR